MEKNLCAPENKNIIAPPADEPEQMLLYGGGSVNLQTLRMRRDELRGPRLSERTLRCYASDWRLFVGWCLEAGRRPLPASTETLNLYITWLLTDRRRRTTTAARHISSVVMQHRAADVATPDRREALEIVAHEKRRRREQPRGKDAITPETLRALILACDPAKPRGVRDRALILLGFGSGLRRSEIAGLHLADISFRPEGIAVYIRYAKTDQGGRGRTVGVWAGQHEATDPVRAVRHWLSIRGEWEGPLFTQIRGGHDEQQKVSHSPILGEVIATAVKLAATRAGLNSSNFSGHSLRAGAVTAAAETGSSHEEIMKMTGHTSLQTMRRYIRDVAAFHGRNPLAGVL